MAASRNQPALSLKQSPTHLSVKFGGSHPHDERYEIRLPEDLELQYALVLSLHTILLPTRLAKWPSLLQLILSAR